MWGCWEETYLQATKDKEFQLKQQLQNIKLGTKIIDEYLKEFKGTCDGLPVIHKLVDEDSRGLCSKYRTFRTVILTKTPYPAVNQFDYAFKDFDMREEENKAPPKNYIMAFTSQREKWRGNYNQRRGNSSYNSR